MLTTTGMKGGGFYDQHSSAQQAASDALSAWLDEAVATLTLPAARPPIVLLDLGSSEGRNALGVMQRAIAGLARTWARRKVLASALSAR